MQREIASSSEHPYVLYSQSYYGTYVPTLKGPWEKEKDEGNVFPPPIPYFQGGNRVTTLHFPAAATDMRTKKGDGEVLFPLEKGRWSNWHCYEVGHVFSRL